MTDTIRRIVSDKRRQRLFYLTNQKPNLIFVSKPANQGSENFKTGNERVE